MKKGTITPVEKFSKVEKIADSRVLSLELDGPSDRLYVLTEISKVFIERYGMIDPEALMKNVMPIVEEILKHKEN